MVQKKRTTDELIADTEYLAAKIKFLKANFPDLKVHDTYGGTINLAATFSSSKVNNEYTGLDFSFGWNNEILRVAPHSLLTFEHNGRIEDIKIHSSPKASRLAYIHRGSRLKTPAPGQPGPQGNPPIVHKWGQMGMTTTSNWERYSVLRFGRVKVNFKTNNFSEKMMEDCQRKIMEFVGMHNGVDMDTKHLDARLKKLLVMI